MSYAISSLGTSYGGTAAVNGSADAQSSVWEIFADITSPQAFDHSQTFIDSVASACALAILPSAKEAAASETLISQEVPQALAEIRHTLSLSTVELAKIFKVSRRAIYDWVEGKNVALPNRQRITEVLAVANSWESRQMGRLGSLVREEVGDRSLLDYLCSDDLENQAVETLLDLIAAKLNEASAGRRVPSAQELMERHSAAPLAGQAYRRNLKASTPPRSR